MNAKIILASTSPRRKEIVKDMGLPFEAMPPLCDEERNEALLPEQQIEDLAFRKAHAVFQRTTGNRIVIGSDTMALFALPSGKQEAARQGHGTDSIQNQWQSLAIEMIGKPANKEDARRMLTAFSGNTHHFITGLCVLSEIDGVIRKQVGHDTGSVTFRVLGAQEIEEYIETGDPYDKAGGYDAINNPISATFVQKRGGSISAIKGLPVGLLEKFLKMI